ncbi:hypothetical protein [Streptomyces bobili]
MGVIDFPDNLVQKQGAWNATYDTLAAPRPADAPLRDPTSQGVSGRSPG